MTERERVLELVLRHGFNATAFQTLEPGYRYWFDGDAAVAYVDTGRAWVVAGAPIAEPGRLHEVARAFAHAARAAGRRCCCFGTEDRFVTATGTDMRHLRIGAQPVWDPQRWTDTLGQQRSLREQLRRAQNKGVQVREVTALELESGPVRAGIAAVAERWLARRRMSPMGFLVHLDPFTFPVHRQCFIAEQEGRIQGFAGVVPVPLRNGWFIEDLVRDPGACNGTSELLVDAVMQKAAAAGCRWLTLGLAPLAGELGAMLHLLRWSARGVYDFDGLYRFKAKLRPQSWLPIHLSHLPTQGAFVSLADASRAFAHCSLWRFGIRCLLRGPPVVLRALAVLLLPWILLLVMAPAHHWFGSPLVKWAWVVFDLLVAAALWRLAARPSLHLATTLAWAVTGDAVLTLVQFVLWNVHHLAGVLEFTIAGVACTAPCLAAAVLWGLRRQLAAGG